MAFQIKNFVSIVAGMLNHVRGTAPELTDFNIGAVSRVMLEAPAIEIEEAYQQAFNGLREAIPVATYQSFNFDRLAAAPASGIITVNVAVSAQDVVIPVGSSFTSPASRTTYVSQAAVTIPTGDGSGTVSVIAVDAGIIGNVPAASPFAPAAAINNFTSASNAALFGNGRNIESDDERKQRFIAYVEALQRGTVSSLEYGARTVAIYNSAGIETERVRAVSIVEPYLEDPEEPFSLVYCYVHNGVGTTTGALVSEVAKVLHGYVDEDTGLKVPGWKAAGVKLEVAAATEVALDITGTITPEPGYIGADLAAAAEDVVAKYILSLDIGAPFLKSRAIILISEIEGVANIVLSSPSADVTCSNSEKLMPDDLAITAV